MNARAKKIFSFILAILFLMQSIHPVFATQTTGGESKTEIIPSEDHPPKESQTEIETPEDRPILQDGNTITIPSERETVDEVAPEEVPTDIPEEVPEAPEENVLGQDLQD